MRENTLELFINGNPQRPIYYTVKKIINAGYTGRNQEEVMKHIEELKEVGVPAPDKIPTYFPKAAALLTTDNYCEVIDKDSTGEAEYVLLVADNEIYVAVGSDHTDRKLEVGNIPKAKQMCPNFISRGVWKFDDIKENWDDLKMRSWIGKDRAKIYQDTTLDAFMRPEELLKRVKALLGGKLEEGTVIFSGTVGALIEGMPFSNTFDVELKDEKRNETLSCCYQIKIIDWIKE
ncbi:DUF2848 family protein [Maledivibacter halophilus]|uniref:2-keto-4-pentenoate hydratase/2-oxohepta-3-ene-1,7-dioic acid hydratase (Catechol pathway) n=1 Tax=Maledivibacter halophilus TaxID=36842 RepID=A0A1T5L3P1_9FIRM|nr:DUF2848 family protein [Maledivibacter halophilus]SKC70601.1 2-keto-4-pentenoate hydratase/2-oxohepta-3-ene-1,7-dioic acid hydratase (catechol pathway) [Maledivibacter halophilus]